MNAKNTKQISYIFLGTLFVGLGTLKVAQRPFENLIGGFLVIASLVLLAFWDKLPVQQLLNSTTSKKPQSFEEETEEDRYERKLRIREENRKAKELEKRQQQQKATSPKSQSPDSEKEESVQRGRSREQKVEPVPVVAPTQPAKKGKKEEPKKEEPKKEEPKKEDPKNKNKKQAPEPTKKTDNKKVADEEVQAKQGKGKDTKDTKGKDSKTKDTKGKKAAQPVQKAVAAPVVEEDDGWEQVEGPVVKPKPKKAKPAQESPQKVVVDQLAVVEPPHDKQKPSKAQKKAQEVVPEDEEWDEVPVIRKDVRQNDQGDKTNASTKSKNKKKK